MTDGINVVRCPACGLSEKQPFPFLATNARKKVAVWYEPIPDQNIDSDLELYRKHFGNDYFLARAERIKNWAAFKQRLIDLNRRPDANPTVEEFVRLKQGMKSGYADATKSRQNFSASRLIASLKTWATKFLRANTSPQLIPPSGEKRAGVDSKCSTEPVNYVTKLEQAISTWDRKQGRIALAIFAAMILDDRVPLETIFGKDAEVKTAIERLTVGQLRVLNSIMAEIIPDDGDDDRPTDREG